MSNGSGEPSAELTAGLYVVATPIGNLEDITLRALRILRSADVVFAEDTRRTRQLLTAHDIHVPVRSLPAFAENRRVAEVVSRVEAGERVALCTDAGMPAVSDPGSETIRAVRSAQLPVTVIPGASALTAAIAGSGSGGGGFTFLGFAPRSPGKLRKEVAAALELGNPVVFFEAPVRLARTLRTMAPQCGDREVVVARELTKIHETWHRGTASELADIFTAKPARGECTVVIHG